MSELKHTPGPWEVLNQTEVFTALGADSGDGVKALTSDGWMVADCGDSLTFSEAGFVELGLDVRKANAKLIAAAPDLLEALEAMVSWASSPIGDVECPDLLARTAIAKATK